jgi:diacylglycerol kinase (ATP)
MQLSSIILRVVFNSIYNLQFLGYRCEWCGLTTHGGCRHFVQQECTFGSLQPIYLPPHAVSIPRTEVPMEAIIGVQVKNKGIPMQREYSCRKLFNITLTRYT